MITIKKTKEVVGDIEYYLTRMSLFFIPVIKIKRCRIGKVFSFRIYIFGILVFYERQDLNNE